MRRGLLDGWWGIFTGESPSVAMEGRCRFERLVLETEAVVSFLICGTCGGTVDQHMTMPAVKASYSNYESNTIRLPVCIHPQTVDPQALEGVS